MADADDLVELLFFDTFSHEIHEDLNLDLVQFPHPVYITEVRIIPLGARVQADFPGGVRLGATNPSKFHIEFFVNDLAKPGASTFERLGDFEYNQNDCISLQCAKTTDRSTGERQIPTDGIVLRGWYTTITLAVYGSIAKDGIGEPQISSPPPIEAIEPIVDAKTAQAIELADTKLDHSMEIDWHPHDVKAQVSGSYGKPTIAAVNELFVDENTTIQVQVYPSTPKDAARSYTEKWIESTDLSAKNLSMKSPEIDTWDTVDDDLSKSNVSSRRSPSPTESRRSKRDASKSPDYRRRRSYERGVLDKKLMKSREYESSRRSPAPSRLPRTPSPELLHSPSSTKRPRTPSESEFSSKLRSNTKIVQSPPSTNEESPATADALNPNDSLPATELDDDAISQDEAFEPILSDDEIVDDVSEQYEISFDETEDANLSTVSVLSHFNPFIEPLKPYIPNDDRMSANAKELIELASKCLHRSKLRDNQSVEQTFVDSSSIEMKENWVQATEQLIQIINLIYNLAGATRDRSQKVLSALITQNERELINWIKIGLNFDCANSQHQPGYKIRHIKCGIRLAELIMVDEAFLRVLIERECVDVFSSLFNLYEQKFMALSIKLMICKAIYACLDTKTGVQHFTSENDYDELKPLQSQVNLNGYQKVLKLLQENPLTRIKFALKSILKKVNLFESLQTIQDIVRRHLVDDDEKIGGKDTMTETEDRQLLRDCLSDVWSSLAWDIQSYLQPKRFLPISTKFESVVDKNSLETTTNSLFCFFRAHDLIASLLLIVSKHSALLIDEEVFDLTLTLIESLCRTRSGLDYLMDRAEITNILTKCLLQAQPEIPAENDEIGENANLEESNDVDEDSRMHRIGMEISFKLRALYCLKAIADVNFNDESREELLVQHFHCLYSLAVVDGFIGRRHVVDIITTGDNIIIILKQIEHEKRLIELNTANSELASAIPKGPILNYAVDLIELTIRYANRNIEYLKSHGQILLNLVKSYESFDSSISQKLQDLIIYLKPLENTQIFAYDNISISCETVRRNLDFVTTFPGDVITSLRIARHLAIPDTSTFDSGSDFVDMFGDASALKTFPLNTNLPKMEQHQLELKYKYAVLQFYSADGISTCVSILDKITTYFAQPSVHSATLSTNQGVLMTQILLPTMELLRKMLTYVIDCRNTEFKDFTAIEPMLKTYSLVNIISSQSIVAEEAQLIQSEIIRALMAYTLPTPTNGVDTESVHKSLWTQMIAELCKYIMNGPSTFMSGLTILMQLLPIPLPVQTKRSLTESEQARIVTERQLWSAHLHPNSVELCELIQALCVSSFAPLLDLLARIIGQLADLAPNMALLTTKAVVDLLFVDASASIQTTELTSNGTNAANSTPNPSSPAPAMTSIAAQQNTAAMAFVNPQTKRVMNFLSNIIGYAPIKVAFISLLPGKLIEQLTKILTVKSATIPSTLTAVLNQEQDAVLSIFHTLLNTDISLVVPIDAGAKSSVTADVALACSLPSREILLNMINGILDHFLTTDDVVNSYGTQFNAIRTLSIFTEFDFTNYHLRSALEKRKDLLLAKLESLSRPSEDDSIGFDIILTLLQFLLSSMGGNIIKNERSIACTESDLARILQFRRSAEPSDGTTEPTIHPLLTLEQQLNDLMLQEDVTTNTKAHIEEIQYNLSKLLKILDEGVVALESSASKKEPNVDSPASELPFPQGDGIVNQFSMRPLFTIISPDNIAMNVNEQLSINFWCVKASPNRLEDLSAGENIDAHLPICDATTCDLTEMIKNCLPAEWNLSNDCKRLLHLSASPQSTRERTTSAPCFRTRRVEVEPSTGRPEKKIYISRGRGFARSAASRSDLFRSRPPNTSRPPSLHVDDFLALETCGAQPTGPTGYNKLSREIISIRGTRGGRGRRISMSSSSSYRHSFRRTNSPSTWNSTNDGNTSTPQHFRTATAEPVHSPHFSSDYNSSHYNGSPIRGRRGGLRPPRSFNKFN